MDEDDINDEATEIDFKIPLDFVTKATEIKVHVIVEDIKATAPKNITFGSGLQISEVSPVATSIGDTITISGIGFSENNTQNKVIFTASSGRVSSLASSVVNGKLKVVVPEKAITGNIVVEVDGKESNELPLEVNESGITVIFGDNGNLADDIFNIAIADKNSVEMDSAGQRSKEIFQQLDIGEYKISLTGEDVPDERGTYYVCFSDNVEVLNGPAKSAKELITGKGDTISWNIKVNSGDPKAVNSCIYNTPQLNNKRKVELLWQE